MRSRAPAGRSPRWASRSSFHPRGPDEHELEVRVAEPGEGADQPGEVLARLDRARPEDEPPRQRIRGPNARDISGRGTRGSDTEWDVAEPGRLEARGAAALQRGQRGAEHERGVPQGELERSQEEAATLAREELGMVEVGEVVHREDQRARPGRHGDARRVDHVHPARRGFHPRPAEVMPRLVERDARKRELRDGNGRPPLLGRRLAVPRGHPDQLDLRALLQCARELQRCDCRPARYAVPALLEGECDPHGLPALS